MQALQRKVYMVLSFKELGINVRDYDGMSFGRAVSLIINLVADRITMAQWQHPVTAVETLYNWPATVIDFVNHSVEVVPQSSEVWGLINQ